MERIGEFLIDVCVAGYVVLMAGILVVKICDEAKAVKAAIKRHKDKVKNRDNNKNRDGNK